MGQQLGLVTEEDGVLLLALIEAHDGVGDLAHPIAAVVRGTRSRAKASWRSRSSAEPESNADRGPYRDWGGGWRGRCGRRWTCPRLLRGEQAGALMIDQKLEPRLDLRPSLRGKQLLGVGVIAEGSFLKPKKASSMATPPGLSSFEQFDIVDPGGLGGVRRGGLGRTGLGVNDRIDPACHALRFPLEVDLRRGGSSGSKRTSMVSPARCGGAS